MIRAAPRRGRARPPSSAYFGNYWDLYWVLDDAQQQLLLRLTPSAFDDDRATWGIVLAQTYCASGRPGPGARLRRLRPARASRSSSRRRPDDAQRHVFRGLALAYLGRKAEAIREGERGVALLPIAKRHATPAPTSSTSSPDLHPGRRAREGARPARAAAQDAVLPLARLAPDRSRRSTRCGTTRGSGSWSEGRPDPPRRYRPTRPVRRPRLPGSRSWWRGVRSGRLLPLPLIWAARIEGLTERAPVPAPGQAVAKLGT